MEKNLEATIRVTVVYTVFAAAWIFFSDRVVEAVVTNPADVTLLQTLKGWLFVVTTGMLLFILVFRSHKKIERIVQLDTLTGLSNHYMFKTYLARQLAERRQQQLLVLCYLDIDDFKVLNQQIGYERADQFLIELARSLSALDGRPLLLGRFPPDQFAVAGLVSDQDEIDHIIAALRRCFREVADKLKLQITCSIGVAVSPDDGVRAKVLMEAANEAQRQAKLERNAVIFHDRALSEASVKRDTLLKELKAALAGQTLSLMYQPKYAIASKEVCGVEALLRWYHPYHGLISPAEFIPLAEENGLIHQITRFVILRSARELTAAGVLGSLIPHVSINVSASEFNRRDQMNTLLELIGTETDLAPFLQIEITETATLFDMEQSAEIVANCRRRGVQVSIDDFGTGYTSLAMLKDLTVDELKIDRCFISELTEEGRSRTIVEAIIAMARSFRINTVAEGVESKEQLAILEEMGCQQVQGFYLGVPMEIEQLKTHLAETPGPLEA